VQALAPLLELVPVPRLGLAPRPGQVLLLEPELALARVLLQALAPLPEPVQGLVQVQALERQLQALTTPDFLRRSALLYLLFRR
jgi:hypothetical protein